MLGIFLSILVFALGVDSSILVTMVLNFCESFHLVSKNETGTDE